MSARLRWFKGSRETSGLQTKSSFHADWPSPWSCSGLAEEIWPLKWEFPVSPCHLLPILCFSKEICSTVRCFIHNIKRQTVFGQVHSGLMQTFTCCMEAMLWLWIRSHSTAALERLLHWMSHFFKAVWDGKIFQDRHSYQNSCLVAMLKRSPVSSDTFSL